MNSALLGLQGETQTTKPKENKYECFQNDTNFPFSRALDLCTLLGAKKEKCFRYENKKVQIS